jgi:hypothetical protein
MADTFTFNLTNQTEAFPSMCLIDKTKVCDNVDVLKQNISVNTEIIDGSYIYSLNIKGVDNTNLKINNFNLNNIIKLEKTDENEMDNRGNYKYKLFINNKPFNTWDKDNNEIQKTVYGNIKKLVISFTQYKSIEKGGFFKSNKTFYFTDKTFLIIDIINTVTYQNEYADININNQSFRFSEIVNNKIGGKKSTYKLSKEPKIKTKSGMKSVYVGIRGGKYVKLNNKYVNIKSIKKST